MRRLRCAACATEMPGNKLGAHFLAKPAHRQTAFMHYAEDPQEASEPAPDDWFDAGSDDADAQECDAPGKLLDTWDDDERRRFAAPSECVGPVVACACGDTMCAVHNVPCDTCGRFACLRHRHSGHCPDCNPQRRRLGVRVPKHDPFSKRTTIVSRTYMRPAPAPWPPAATDDDSPGGGV